MFSMLLSFTEDPEGRQHYGTQIQGMALSNRLRINHELPPGSRIRYIILDVL
jgi:hypothetical protein